MTPPGDGGEHFVVSAALTQPPVSHASRYAGRAQDDCDSLLGLTLEVAARTVTRRIRSNLGHQHAAEWT